MGKITVQHYLNTNLKPYIIGGKNYYKVYVLIRANTQNTKVKSDISNNEYTLEEFDELVTDKESELSVGIENEINIINFIIDKIQKDGKTFSSSLYTEYSKKYKIRFSEIDLEVLSNGSIWGETMRILGQEKYVTDEMRRYYILSNTGVPPFITKEEFNQFIVDNLSSFKNLLAENYETQDVYVCQWITANIRKQFERIFLRAYKDREKEILDREKYGCRDNIKSFLNNLNEEILNYLSN